MTWVDVLLIGFVLVSVGAGASLGSLWAGACLAGGFFGAFLADMLTAPALTFLGSFPGKEPLLTAVLFLGGCVVILIPGWFLSRAISALFFGMFDRAAGIFVGLVAGLCAVSICLIGFIPLLPRMEKSRAWKKSSLVRPLQRTLENVFSGKHFQKPSKLAPASKKMGIEIKEAAEQFVDEVKKSK